MKRLNRILLVFLGITFLTLYGGWRFIHSEKFSKEISQRVSKILTEKIGAQLSFAAVEFSLFPLSTTFKDVKLSKMDPTLVDAIIEARDLEIAFTYSSFVASELEIDQISLRNGSVKLNINKKSEEDIILKDLNTKKIFIKYNEIFSQVPVRINFIAMENINLNIDKTSMFVNRLSFSPQRTRVRLKADVSNLHLDPEIKDIPPIQISRIQGLLSLEKDEWRIDNLKVIKGKTSVDVHGVAFNENGFLNLATNGNITTNIEDLFADYKSLPKEVTSIKGRVEGSFETSGAIDNPDINFSFVANNAETEWIKLQKVEGTLIKKKNLLIVQKAYAVNGSEKYTVKKPEAFFDIEAKKFTNFHFYLKMENAFTNTFLYAIKSSLGTLKGHLTGDIEASLYDDKAVFEIKDKVNIKNFRLTNSDGKKDILKNPGFGLETTTITINKDFSVDVDAKAVMANSLIKAKGKISEKGIDIAINDSKVDMQALGPIAGINISGSGPSSVKISGPLDDVLFIFDVDWNNFSVVDLNFGKVKANFSLGLKEMELVINKFEGVYNKSVFSALGSLNFQDNTGMDIKIDFKSSTFSDAKKMYHLVFKNLKMPVEPEFNFEASYTVKGGYDLESLRVEGQIKGTDLKIVNEEAERLSVRFSLINKMLNFKQLKISKSRGELNANVNINLVNNYIELGGATRGLRMRDFNFYRNLSLEYDGDLFVDFDGSGTIDEFSSRFKTRVTNAFIENMPASSSNALFYINSQDVVTNASLLGGKVKIDSLMSFKTGIAAIKSSIDTTDIREFLGVFAGHNISDKGITGKIRAQLNTQISLGSLGVRRFFLDIDQLDLNKGDIKLSIDPRFNKIEVDEGVVKNWDLRLSDGKEFLQSKGRNISNGVIALDQKFALKASLLEIATEYVDRATGVVKGSNQIILDKKMTVKEFSLQGDDHALKIKNLPGYITDFDFSMVKKGENFEVVRMTGKYGEGEFKIGGKLYFDDLYPQVNLDYKIDKATVPLFKRSSVLITSNGTLTGTNLPYKLNGKVLFLYGEFLDDPMDFMKDNKVTIDEYKKYLPSSTILGNRGLLDLNVTFDTVTPVVLRNNLAEVHIKGNGQVTGDVLSPEISTRLEIVPNISKFKFKGHDFILSQGYVEIRDRGKNRVSDLKFTGVSKISEYDMKLDLSGSISKVNVDLSSEPALSKEDLLSLLTLGVTSDMSRNLEAGERKFVTTVGIGTLLVDQLKINEDLNSSLGLKLSVQPEFKEDEAALIQGKSAVSDGSSSRLKSATKIKVNKQINRRVDVSLSSTVGGSLEPKQEMNINLNINKNFSLEGVYEVKPSEDENTNSPNSKGIDLKWRKSF